MITDDGAIGASEYTETPATFWSKIWSGVKTATSEISGWYTNPGGTYLALERRTGAPEKVQQTVQNVTFGVLKIFWPIVLLIVLWYLATLTSTYAKLKGGIKL